MKYPPCPSEPLTETLFGQPVSDPYRWLEDERAPRVQEFIDAQDRFARDHLSRLPGRDALHARLRSLLYYDAVGTPRRHGTRYFYSRKHAHAEKSVVCMREGLDGPERVLLDPARMEPADAVSLGVWQPSPDGRVVAYARRVHNADEATLHILDVDDGTTRPGEVLPDAKYASPSFTPQGDGFYYTRLPTHDERGQEIPAQIRPGHAEIRFHRLGTDASTDLLVYPHTGDPQRFLHAELSRDGRFLLLFVQRGWHATDVRVCDLRPYLLAGTAPPWAEWGEAGAETLRLAFQPLFVGRDAKCTAVAWGDTFYLLTDENAPRGRVLAVRVGPPARSPGQVPWRHKDNPRELIPESPEAVIEDVSLIGGRLLVSYLERAHSALRIFDLDGRLVRELPLPGLGVCHGASGEPQPEADELFYSFSSFLTPPQIYRASAHTGAAALWASTDVPGLEITRKSALAGENTANPAENGEPSTERAEDAPFVTEQVFYTSRDGTRVSMFVLRGRDLPRDGSAPFLLSGYGGFNVSMLPEFAPSFVPFLEAGGGIAIPNLRGGGEYGEAWHRAGMLDKKQNVFDDFIAAAEFLIDSGYTSARRLAVRGGSNGGLLVGALVTQRPELCRAAVCAVPLLDMVRYHRFGSGMTWVPEYGSAENEAQFRALLAYSPYHHVTAAPYPAVLLLSADHDDRVDPLHARKMAALLQSRTTSDRPVLLRIERGAGHTGADHLARAIEQSADVYAFLLDELGGTGRT